MTSEQDPTLDPDTFDITAWLAGEDPDAYRSTETVTVYLLKPGLREEIDLVKAQYDAAVKAEKDTKRAQLAVGEARQVTLLQNRMENLMADVEGARREITLVGLIGPEIDQATQDVDAKDTMARTYALIAAAARVDGKHLTPHAVAVLHRAIGEGQWADVVAAYQKATYGKPGVTAPFSPRS
jgi:hypothetical protein